MQVKKFEAKNMQEALEMVKRSLGPDAVILQAKDNASKFGIGGKSSIEVTAAVSEGMYRKKQIVEARMTEQIREKFQRTPASRQKQYIEKAFEKREQQPHELTTIKYVDILDEKEELIPNPIGLNVEQALKAEQNSSASATQRIRQAAISAWNAGQETIEQPVPKAAQHVQRHSHRAEEVFALKKEIKKLQGIIANFKQVPQTIITSHPGANEGINFELSAMFEKLTRAGVSSETAVAMLKQVQSTLSMETIKKQPYVDAWVAKRILETTRISEDRFSPTKYHVFVGGMGQGKTSTLVKFASQLVLKKRKKIIILSTDNKKIGASEQLKIFAQILNVPFCNIQSQSDWHKIDTQLKGIDHILVDFPGMHLRSEEELAYFSKMLPPTNGGRKIHYVQSLLTKDENAFKLYESYRGFGISDVIFTGLDEANQHGLIYNFQKRYNIPLHSFGIGPNIPEDFELATKERVVDLIFKLTKIKNPRSQQ